MSWILPAEQFMSWGWRVAFWLSAVIVVIGYYIRTHVNEAPIFLEARAQVEAEQSISYGVTEVIRKYPRGIVSAMGLRFAENILYYIIVSFSIVYLVTVHAYDTSQLLLALLLAHVVHFLVIPQVGRLSDRVGRRPVYLAGAILGATWALFAFPMFDTQNPVLIILAITLGLFPTRMRYSGVSLGYQVTSILAGSMAPIIAVALLKEYNSWVPVAIYLAGACAITVVAVLTLTETKGISLRELDAVDARKHGLAPAVTSP